MRLVFLGLAGAGKGTQAKMVADHLGIPFVASGDLFRYHQAKGTELGLLAKGYMERGALVPDNVTIKMILERIGQKDAKNGFVLDGFPRTLQQAEALDQALGKGSIDAALYVRVREEELVRRLSGRISCRQCGTPYQKEILESQGVTRCPSCGGELYQRADDAPDVVRRRLQVQRPEIMCLVDYYAGQEKLTEVEGEQSVEAVGQEVLKALSRYAAAARPVKARRT